MSLRYHTPLTAEEQLAQGLTVPQRFALADKVRYAELDILNHVNNKSYMTWFETLRVSYFDHCCADLFAQGPRPRTVLRSADIRFVKEMLANESYVATAQVTELRTTSYTMEQQLWSGDLRARMTAVMVMMTPEGTARMPLPGTLVERFRTLDGAVPHTGS